MSQLSDALNFKFQRAIVSVANFWKRLNKPAFTKEEPSLAKREEDSFLEQNKVISFFYSF
jgi:hypothetical protein